MLADERHDIEGAQLGGSRPILDAEVAADDAMELQLAFDAGNDAGGVQQLADPLHRDVGSKRLGRFRQFQAEGAQRCFGGVHAHETARPGGKQTKSTSSTRLRRASVRLDRLARPRHHEPVEEWLTDGPAP